MQYASKVTIILVSVADNTITGVIAFKDRRLMYLLLGPDSRISLHKLETNVMHE